MASKTGLFKTTRACYDDAIRSPLLGSRVVNFVHDEQIGEVPEDAIDECAREISRLMNEAMKQWCPDIPTKTEAAAMTRWSKKAKPVHDKEGRLTVCPIPSL